MTIRICFSWVSVLTLFASSTAMAEPPVLVPVKDGGDVLLFDAGRHEMNGLRNYTASWKIGKDERLSYNSDCKPSAVSNQL